MEWVWVRPLPPFGIFSHIIPFFFWPRSLDSSSIMMIPIDSIDNFLRRLHLDCIFLEKKKFSSVRSGDNSKSLFHFYSWYQFNIIVKQHVMMCCEIFISLATEQERREDEDQARPSFKRGFQAGRHLLSLLYHFPHSCHSYLLGESDNRNMSNDSIGIGWD